MNAADEVQDRFRLAELVFHEAEGEGFAGKLMVAGVVVTRSRQRGLSVSQVCFEPGQFTGFGSGTGGNRLPLPTGEVWAQSLAAADIALAHPDSWEATHFHSVKMDPYPSWHDPEKVVAVVGGHVFLRL